MGAATIGVTEKEDEEQGIDEQDIFDGMVLFLAAITRGASIRGSATLCSSRWTQRRGCQLHRLQYRREHRARLLTEKALRSRRSVRPREEKVVNRGEALPLARPIESSQLMATQGQVAVAPLDIGTRALEHTGEPFGLVVKLVLGRGAQRLKTPPGANNGARSRSASSRSGAPSLTLRVWATRSREEEGRSWACMAKETGGVKSS